MSISKLYLFSKNTDAPFVARGFEYQKMKTLETWLNNYLRQVDEVIYCDYEEDVFQRNDQSNEARFRQIKLYSTNFSFKSEEVQKAVAHFFMFHVNSDYQDWNKQFVFEASSGVAATRGDNEADLFRDWVAGQDNLSAELLAKCTAKVKQFVTDYIEKQAKKLSESIDPAILEEALQVLRQLGEEEWQEFTRRIRWDFAEEATPEAAFAAAHARVQDLLKQLPFDLPEVQQRALEGILWEIVSFKIAGSTPADRALTLAELEDNILASGSEKEQWYGTIYQKWRAAALTGQLRPGEILEIINAANYCRWTASLAGHAEFWLSWLRIYIDNARAVAGLRHSALYEYLFLRMRPTSYYTPPSGTVEGNEDYARSYFQNLENLRNPAELENAQSLLFLVVSAYRLRRIGLAKAEITGWLSQFGAALQQAIAAAPTPSSRCRLLECEIANQFFTIRARNAAAKLAVLQPLVTELLQYLPDAAQYNVTHLSEKLHQYQLILLKAQLPEYIPLLDELDEIAQQLEPFVQARSGAHRRAKKLVVQAAELVQQNSPQSLLLALHRFHGAKDLWNNKEAIEGFVLALFQIAHLYQMLGLSLAAKYYALGAAWVCEHSDGSELLAREPEALALVFQADFQQGAWLSAMAGFETYLRTRYQFNPQTIDLQKEPAMLHAVAEYATMLFTAPQFAPTFEPVLRKQLAGFPAEIRELLIEPSVDTYKASLAEMEVPEWLRSKLADRPLSDAGGQRIIAFRALGSSWTLVFANTYRMVPVAEEFAAHLQILLAEVALSAVDFHLPKGRVELRLVEAKKWSGPKRVSTNSSYAWEIPLRFFDKPDPDQIRRATTHVSAALMIILGEISLLPAEEFKAEFTGLYEKSGLATKNLFANAYQRMYRYFVPHKRFTSLLHQQQQPVDSLPGVPIESPAMQWKSSLSTKYDQQTVDGRIQERFENSTRCIFLTLGRLQQQAGYPHWLAELRQAGWPDWQIAMAMANYMIQVKVRRLLATQEFASEDQFAQAMKKEAGRVWHLSEAECYHCFSLESFQSEEFMEQLKLNAFFVLRSYGLVDSGKTPYFDAIREFLQVRFNGQQPGMEEANPFLVEQHIDLDVISQAIEKDWESGLSLRFIPGDESQNQPAVSVLTFRQSTQGHVGYELLLDFFPAHESVLVISTVKGKVHARMEDPQSGVSLTLGERLYRPEELEAFLAQQSANASFVFAIGTEESQGRGLIATRTPYSPFVVGSHRFEKAIP